MPATVKVKVFAARNLPVMDRASFLTDAFVELRLGSTFFKTDVIRRSLNPEWNSDWFCFELGEEALQEETLQIRVLDHDTYSAHDAIGRVYFNLTPLLQAGQKRSQNGWFPLYDTMHGIRGEINLAVRVDSFSEASRRRFSSLGVRCFFSTSIPSGYRCCSLLGFVQELVMNDDPEHQWIEKIRTSRASNEARQRLFSQLSGELQRKISRKVLNMSGNSVVGYQLHFDLEGDTGILARAVGTACFLQRLQNNQPSSPINNPSCNRSHATHSSSVEPDSWLDASVPEDSEMGSHVLRYARLFPLNTPKPLDTAEFPFLTITQPPVGLIRHFGSAVAAKSVKLLEKNVADNLNVRSAWWLELRTEALTHMQNVGCDALIGYREECSIFEDVCVLSIYATAVCLNPTWSPSSSTLPATRPLRRRSQPAGDLSAGRHRNLIVAPQNCSSTADFCSVNSPFESPLAAPLPSTPAESCALCHIPSVKHDNLSSHTCKQCALCKSSFVPEFIFSSTDFPENIPVSGRPSFIQAGLCRSKKEDKGESSAKEISELLPFMEYELHYRLLQKLRLRGMNAIFGLSFQLAVGEDLIAILATGTGVFISALPTARSPNVCCVARNLSASQNLTTTHLQQNVRDFQKRCCERFCLLKEHANGETDCKEDNSAGNVFHRHRSCDQRASSAVEGENDKWMMPSFEDAVVVDDDDNNNKDEVDSVFNKHKFSSVDQDTYFVDARDPEPEELTFLISEPLPPPGMLLMTTNYPPNNKHCLTWLSKQTKNALNTNHGLKNEEIKLAWQPTHTFVKVHTVPCIVPDDTLGSTFFASTNQQRASVASPVGDSQLTLPEPITTEMTLSCLANCLQNANQLTWFRFRASMPCVLSALTYRMCLTEDDVMQIVCIGAVLLPSVTPTSPMTNDAAGIADEASADSICVANANPLHEKVVVGSGGNKKIKFSRSRALLNFLDSGSSQQQSGFELKPVVSDSGTDHVMLDGTNLIEKAENDDISSSQASKGKFNLFAKSAKSLFKNSLKYLNTKGSCDLSDSSLTACPCRRDQLTAGSGDGGKQCLLTPLSSLPNNEYQVVDYFGNISFFFVRETTDLREMGGLRCFVHASITEAQSVVSAHTVSLGGNALLSFCVSQLHLIRPKYSRNQAQCLLNLCGDMVRLSATL